MTALESLVPVDIIDLPLMKTRYALFTSENGGVTFNFTSIFHPAISSGILLGCWERAFGRNGRLNAVIQDAKLTIEIHPSREIS